MVINMVLYLDLREAICHILRGMFCVLELQYCLNYDLYKGVAIRVSLKFLLRVL